MTMLPIVLKSIMSVKAENMAMERGIKITILFNHEGTQLDGSPSSLKVALEIYQTSPVLLDKIEVYADGGVRYVV